MSPRTFARNQWLLLYDLRCQLPRTRGPMRGYTERAIRRIEEELAGGRGRASKAATR